MIMSEYIEVVNRIKKNFSKDWLTPSQMRAFEELTTFLSPPHRVINIFGEKGAGKTFLGWVLQKEGVGIYVHSYEDLIESQRSLILDNYSNRRKLVRRIRNDLEMKNIGNIVILTRHAAEDDIPCIEVRLTEDDIRVAKANLYRVDIKVTDDNITNMWEIIKNAEVE
jgi:ABC-type Na+ transport system ATPase subunit NatA